MKQKGLGRGLDAIFGNDHLDAKLKPMTEMAEIAVSEIIPNPTQPRTQFDEEALDELADSIRTLGVIQPITVKRQGDGKYIIISGERRWRAAQRADVATLPAYIREVDDENLHAMALVENIQRQDLNAIEIALGMQRLIDECGLTQDALSEKVGKKRSTVSNFLRLLKLPDEIQLALKEGLISAGHANAASRKTSRYARSRSWCARSTRSVPPSRPKTRSIPKVTCGWWSSSNASSRRRSASSGRKTAAERSSSISPATPTSKSSSPVSPTNSA